MIDANLLQGLQSVDPVQRKQAEDYLESLSNKSVCLLQALQTPDLRCQLVAVLLRRECMKLTDVNLLQSHVEPLLALWKESNGMLGNAIADCLSAIIAVTGILQVETARSMLQHVANTALTHETSSALRLLLSLAQEAPRLFCETCGSHMVDYIQSQSNHANPLIQLVVATAISTTATSYLVNTPSNPQHTAPSPLVQALATQSLPALLQHPSLDDTTWQALLQAADTVPTLLMACPIELLVTHEMGISVAVALLRNATTKSRFGADHLVAMVTVLLQQMKEEEDDDDDNDDTESVDSLAQELLFGIMHYAYSDAAWQTIVASQNLDAIGIGFQAAPVSLAPQAGPALEMALQQPQNHRAIQLIAILGDLYPQDVGSVPAVYETLARALASAPPTAIGAARGLASLAQEGPAESSSQSLALILQHMPLQLSQDVRQLKVQRECVNLMGCLAQATEEAFVPFAPAVLAGLWNWVQQPPSAHEWEWSSLRGASLQAATLIGQAIAEEESAALEEYKAQATSFLQWIVPRLDLDNGIPMDMLLSSCARMARVLGPDVYAPFALVVLPRLGQRAAAPADVEFQAATNDADDDEGGLTVTIPGRGKTRASIQTSQLTDKAQALRGIYEHAVAMDDIPDLPKYLDHTLELVEFPYSSEIRSVAGQTLAALYQVALVRSSVVENMDLAGEYLGRITKAIAEQLHKQDPTEHEALFALADALSEVLYNVHGYLPDYREALLSNLGLSQAQEIVQFVLSQAMVACLGRRRELVERSAAPNLGPDERAELEQDLKHEETLLTPLVDSVGYLLKFFRHEFVPIFENLVFPVLGPCLTGPDIRARHAAVCLFDDCVEHCGVSAAAKFSPELVKGVMLGLNPANTDEELLQSSVYGVAQMARYTPSSVLKAHVSDIMPRLLSLASQHDYTADNLCIVENAVSALASLCLIGSAPFQGAPFVKHEAVTEVFLRNLPLCQDDDEAKICHAGFCDLLERNAIPCDAQTCPTLLRIFGETLALVQQEEEDVAEPETCLRMVGLLYRYQQEMPQIMQGSFGGLTASAQTAIQQSMEQHAYQFNNVVTP